MNENYLKNGEFDIENKKRSGRPKVYEDEELEALLDQDSCQKKRNNTMDNTFVLKS